MPTGIESKAVTIYNQLVPVAWKTDCNTYNELWDLALEMAKDPKHESFRFLV